MILRRLQLLIVLDNLLILSRPEFVDDRTNNVTNVEQDYVELFSMLIKFNLESQIC